MVEAVRLVIWDLDETFWAGTLTEGGITPRPEVAAMVIELARRGIVSSICSRNDRAAVERILTDIGLWSYFVFPSIDWAAKGARVRDLVEAVQLRAASVLFIDDNPLNLAEALHYLPDLQVASDRIIPTLLQDPRLAGKSDPALERLQQYRMLEQRHEARRAGTADNAAFLRASGITVSFEFDIDSHIDRAIELINRTNQLNFTKNRLPEDRDAARLALRELLRRFDVYAGLVRVRDRYGDHGFAGLYVTEHNEAQLKHFCFSCRILGMGVESWLYQRLGRPALHVKGPVLTDLARDKAAIDWITVGGWGAKAAAGDPRVETIIAHGGCDLAAVLHYCRNIAKIVHGEFNVPRDGMDIRRDHSSILRIAMEGASSAEREAFAALGYRAGDLETRLFDAQMSGTSGGTAVWLFSFWQEVDLALYRHRRTGVLVPFAVHGFWGRLDATPVNVADLAEPFRKHWIADALATLKTDFDFVGPIGEQAFKQNLEAILSRIRSPRKVFILLKNAFIRDAAGTRIEAPHIVEQNQWIRDVTQNDPAVSLLDVRQFILAESEVQEWNHFDRAVYFRIFREIERQLSGPREIRCQGHLTAGAEG